MILIKFVSYIFRVHIFDVINLYISLYKQTSMGHLLHAYSLQFSPKYYVQQPRHAGVMG